MPNPRLATRYAKSLIDLATEKGLLEAVNKDIEFLQSAIAQSPEFRMVLGSPIIKPEKKTAILGAVTKNKISVLTSSFFDLLLRKSREDVLPEIVHAFKVQYNLIKGINKVKFTTAHPVSQELKDSIIAKLSKEANLTNVELETKVDESLIGGFLLEYNNKVVDASVKNDLDSIRKSFLRNDYIFNIR